MPQIPVAKALAGLREEFFQLAGEKDRNKAGLALEGFLKRLFETFQLRPRQPYRIVGEQIDGAFELDGHIYLVEAKWGNHPLPEADLLVFRGKIEGKSTFTRGVFVALNGISSQARFAITQGKAPSFFVIDGYDIMMVISEANNAIIGKSMRRRHDDSGVWYNQVPVLNNYSSVNFNLSNMVIYITRSTSRPNYAVRVEVLLSGK